MRLVKKTIHELDMDEVLMVNNWEYDDENDELMLYYDDLLVDTLGIWEMFNPYVMKFYELVKP